MPFRLNGVVSVLQVRKRKIIRTKPFTRMLLLTRSIILTSLKKLTFVIDIDITRIRLGCK
jgi:hypothetical protein